MTRAMLFAGAILAAGIAAAQAEAEKGRWHPVQNIPGCVVWNQDPQPEETASWSGTCSQGKAEGPGTLVWRYREGGKMLESRATSLWRAGKKNGRGVVTWANGNRYEGEFRDDKRTGRGVLTGANGDRYEGEFRDGKMTGHGIRTWRRGTQFEGRFLDGKPAGAGICRAAGRTGRCLIENNEISWLD